MLCRECDTVMHKDSQEYYACIKCGFKYKEDENNVEESERILINDTGETIQTTEETLNERGKRYGKFSTHSELSQQLKETLFTGNSGPFPKAYMNEALEMICHKLARIANGDPYYDDNWRDIAGYAELVVKELNKEVT